MPAPHQQSRDSHRAVLLLLLPLAVAVAAWLYFWGLRAGLSWGCSLTTARVAAATLGLASLVSLCWRPIPIRVSSVAVAYLLLFSLLTSLLRPLLLLARPPATLLLCWDGGLLVPAATALLLLYGWLHGQRTRLQHYQIRLHKPLSSADGMDSTDGANGSARLRLAVVSDVHMGFSVDEQRLSQQCQLLRAAQPDLLLILGDLVDDQTTQAQLATACRLLGQICPGRAYFVYGNHDLASHGPRLHFSRQQLEQELATNQIQLLDDSCQRLHLPQLRQELVLIGRRDAGFGREEDSGRLPLSQLLARANVDANVDGDGKAEQPLIILLDHQPRQLRQARLAGVDLQLSGHTHGGQLWPMGWLSGLRPYHPSYGHHHYGRLQAIVSAGLGNRGNRLRSGCTAETVLIDIYGNGDNDGDNDGDIHADK